ncbi:histamine H2 receptor-like [Actinia tenebrosa]|uniref:Histamine H2 receptor-like n=1 Tax=Actinia tenebrosa TaxID=6105 RepID=A0A6P8IGS7_ACTTE|nr:histamine H2 receptor-like [Actinia tenebrosa]
MSIFYSLSGVAATCLNYLILRVIWKTPSLRKSSSNLLLASLALTDFLVGVTVQPLMILINITAIEKLRKIFCIISIIGENMGFWLASISLGTLALISIDRVLAVKLKTRYKTTVTAKRVLSGTFGLLLVIILCYSLAFRTLTKMTSSVSQESLPETTSNPSSSAIFDVLKYRKSLKTMLIILLTIILFYVPYFGVIVGKLVIYKTDFWRQFSTTTLLKFHAVSEFMVYLNSTVNPVIYCGVFVTFVRQQRI